MDPRPDEPKSVTVQAPVATATVRAIAGTPTIEMAADVASTVARAPEVPGNLTRLELSDLGSCPRACPQVKSAWWRLVGAHDSVQTTFDTLLLVRQKRATEKNQSTRGRLHNDAQDLLRAAIVFTSAGVDSAVQELMRGALPDLVGRSVGTARSQFNLFLDEHVRADKVTDAFRAALKSEDPRATLLDLYIESKTKASFQRSADLKKRAKAALAITHERIPEDRFLALDDFFIARNAIVHELDMKPGTRRGGKPVRTARVQQAVQSMCDLALLLVRDMIAATAEGLKRR
jgi:hypothetical protein